MSALGINVPLDGSVPPDHVAALGASWIRIVATRQHNLRDYLVALNQAGISTLMVLARESFDGAPVGERVLDYYWTLYGDHVRAWQCGNEPDGEGESSWQMSSHAFAALGRSVRDAMPTATLVAGGLVSGQPGWLRNVDLSWADAIACHLYAKDVTPGNDLTDIWEVLEEYKAYGLPAVMSEWGWWGDDEERAVQEVEDMVSWAAQTDQIAAFFYFCHSDRMVPPFGLLDERGHWKDRAWAFKRAAETVRDFTWPTLPVAPPPPPVNRAAELLDRIEADLRELRSLVI